MFDSLTVLIDQLAAESLHSPATAFPIYLVAGLLSSLFPCVYPLIPVTVGFLQKRSEPGDPRWLHPLAYWGGTVIAYAILGLLAAAGGGAFNKFMQNGAVVTGTGFLFLFLTFAILDWHPITFSGGQKIYERARSRTGLAFTLSMGVAAGFIASACVAPALVSMLIFIAKASAMGSSPVYWTVYGAGLSAAFGAGLGVPFFLAGIFGARLPKSGAWMNRVKVFFAILIFLAAVYQIIKGLQVTGYNDMEITGILLGLGLILASALLGLKPPEKNDRPALTRFIFALFALALGFGSVISGMNRYFIRSENTPSSQSSFADDGGNEMRTLSPQELQLLKKEVEKETIAGMPFYRDPDFAMALARAKQIPVFIDFYADWCTNCKDFYRLVESDANLQSALKDSIVLKVVDTDPFFSRFQEDPRFEELNIGLPFFVILDPDGKIRWKTTNYRDTKGMIENLK